MRWQLMAVTLADVVDIANVYCESVVFNLLGDVEYSVFTKANLVYCHEL